MSNSVFKILRMVLAERIMVMMTIITATKMFMEAFCNGVTVRNMYSICSSVYLL